MGRAFRPREARNDKREPWKEKDLNEGGGLQKTFNHDRKLWVGDLKKKRRNFEKGLSGAKDS